MKSIKYVSLLASTLLVQSNLFAQPGPGGGGGPGPGCWPPQTPCVPIDNGIVFLIIAGTLLGAKTIYDFSKKNKTVS